MSKKIWKPPLVNLVAALTEYDRTAPARQVKWDAVQTNEDVNACLAMDKEADDKVREAFYQDTKDRNSKDRAYLVSPNELWLRDAAKVSADRLRKRRK